MRRTARTHPLSTFTPLCPRCALPLCSLHAPLLPCPSCRFHPLLGAPQRTAHLARVERERADYLDAVRDELRREPDRFPELRRAAVASAGTSAIGKTLPPPPPQAHVVMSLGKGGTVTRTVHRPAAPKAKKPAVSSTTPSPADDDELADPAQRPITDPDDDGVAVAPTPTAPIEGRPYANPHLRDDEREVYTPPERLDAS